MISTQDNMEQIICSNATPHNSYSLFLEVGGGWMFSLLILTLQTLHHMKLVNALFSNAPFCFFFFLFFNYIFFFNKKRKEKKIT